MEYVLLIKDQLQVFLGSLQELIAGKHDIVKSSFPPSVNFQLVENLEVEVVSDKVMIMKAEDTSIWFFHYWLDIAHLWLLNSQ